MLRTLVNLKYISLLSFLAVLYLAVGSQALHPYFHNHSLNGCGEKHHCVNTSAVKETVQHQGAHRHEHEYHENSSASLDHKSNCNQCPICDFLACCWLVPAEPTPFFFALTSAACATIPYQAAVDSSQPFACPIRGPPGPTC